MGVYITWAVLVMSIRERPGNHFFLLNGQSKGSQQGKGLHQPEQHDGVFYLEDHPRTCK